MSSATKERSRVCVHCTPDGEPNRVRVFNAMPKSLVKNETVKAIKRQVPGCPEPFLTTSLDKQKPIIENGRRKTPNVGFCPKNITLDLNIASRF